MAVCLTVLKRCQHVEARLDYGFDWTQIFARKWASDQPFLATVAVRPTEIATGFQYVSSGGQSGEFEPTWPKVLGAQVVDGSITWTAELITVDSLADQIVSDGWTSDSATGDLDLDPAAPIITAGMQRTAAFLSLGTTGQTYTVENEVLTTLGAEYVARLVLTIE